MTIIESLLLGFTQGITEFVPVSSSGHLILAEQVLGLGQDSFAFDALLNIGTLMALIIYFRRDLIQLALSLRQNATSQSLVKNIFIATIPGVLAGIFLQAAAESYLRSHLIVIVMLVLVGLAMIIVEKYGHFQKTQTDISPTDSLAIGLAQVLAFLPGTSRSGITITAGIARGLSRQTATVFSFYLAIPILGGGILKILFSEGVLAQVANNIGAYIAGIGASFISGYIAISFLIKYLKNHSLTIFAYYRITLAFILSLVLVLL